MQTYVDLRNIFETVNNEFSKRIEETASAKRSLEKELARVKHCFILQSFISKRHNIQVEENLEKIIPYTATPFTKATRQNSVPMDK